MGRRTRGYWVTVATTIPAETVQVAETVSAQTEAAAALHNATPFDILGGAAGGVLQWCRADLGITLGATPLASGTLPPAVTLSGTLAQALGVRIEIQTTGIRGTATFRWSTDNGTTWTESSVVTAATYALGTTGITANFPVGTYTNDNVYKATIATWADQSGAALDYTQATAGLQPVMLKAGGANSTQAMQFDGVDDELYNAAFDLPAPGTTPTYIFAVLRQDTWTINAGIVAGSAAANVALAQQASTPNIKQSDGSAVNENSAGTLGTWFRVEGGFQNTTGDFLKVGATSVTGAAAGNNDPAAGRAIGTRHGSTVWSALSVAELLYLNRIPTSTERTQVDNSVTARYGAGLV